MWAEGRETHRQEHGFQVLDNAGHRSTRATLLEPRALLCCCGTRVARSTNLATSSTLR